MDNSQSGLFKRVEEEISNYLYNSVEVAEGVFFNQRDTIKRIYKFRNRSLDDSKVNEDLTYNYYTDIISSRVESEVKNLKFDTKNIKPFSLAPLQDFAAVFIANASLKVWMSKENRGIDLKEAIEEFVANGNIGFKKISGGYEVVDPLNTYITNISAKTVDETNIIERHEMTASEMLRKEDWDYDTTLEMIEKCGDSSFQSTGETTEAESTTKTYEVFEYLGEVTEKEFYSAQGIEFGDENTTFLARIIFAGLREDGKGDKFVPFIERLPKGKKQSDYYKYAHRGKYNKRFWREGMYEILIDHQIRANEIYLQLARGLDWSSKVVFRSKDTNVMENIRADIENGDVIITDDLEQVLVRMQGADQLIADWNRLMADADRIANSFEIVRGETLPSGTPFRLGALLDQNSGMFFSFLRQKITIPYRQVFQEWVLPELVKDLKAEKIFSYVGDSEILDKLREIMVNNWYMKNVVKMGYHTKEVADAIKAEKLEELRQIDPVIENSKEIWEGILPRLMVTITGENSDVADQITDIINLIELEQDPNRRAVMLDTIYASRGIPVPPRMEQKEQPNMAAGVGGAKPTPKQVTPEQVMK